MNGCHCLYVCLQLLLSLAGLLSVGMSIGFAYGLATTFGVIYGPVHAIMPFLLLGKRTHIHVLWLTSTVYVLGLLKLFVIYMVKTLHFTA